MSTEKMLNGGIRKLLTSFSALHVSPPEQEEEDHLITGLQGQAARAWRPHSNISAVDGSWVTCEGSGKRRPPRVRSAETHVRTRLCHQ